MIFICIPIFNRIAYTLNCLQSIQQQVYKSFTVVICDDGSTDGSAEMIASKYPDVVLLKGDGNLWWTGGINECIKYVIERAGNNDYIFTLNNDTELVPDTLQTLITFTETHPDSLVACANHFLKDKRSLESTAFVQRSKWPFSAYHKPLFPWGENVNNLKEPVYEVSSVSGKGVLVPVKVFRTIGLYNAAKLPHYHADAEFARRASKAGYKVFFNVNAIIYTDSDASGIGQVNSKISLTEFIKSFGSMRSENHLRSLYNRSKLYYGTKWMVYLIPNLLFIWYKFLIRYGFHIKQSIFS